MNRSQLLSKAGLSVFTPNYGQSPIDYAAAQMQGRGQSYISGPFSVTGRKLVAAQSVNGIAFVTLSRVNLTDAEKADVKGFQIIVYDLAGSIIHATPLDDTAPKGTKRGYAVYGEVCSAVADRDDLVYTAIRGVADAAKAKVEELEKLLLKVAPAPAPEGDTADAAEPAASEA
jgi:hypothetical protein